MKKIFTLLLGLTLGLGLASCGEEEQKPVNPTVEAKDFTATREDDREAVYHHYNKDGEKQGSYASLYTAINVCVDEGDIEDYILQEGSDQKLFVNYEKYDADTVDMYWYYDDVNKYKNYSFWDSGYWGNLKGTNDITVFKAASNGTVTYYANGYDVVKTNSDRTIFKVGQADTWQVCWELEANVTVDMAAYSGITKSVYKIDLSEAMITPSYEGSDAAFAYVGFITADSLNVSNQGLMCDTSNGNWYYHSGETSIQSNNIKLDDENCYLTSTWDEEAGCFRPDGDVTMTMELLTLTDEDGEEYVVHRLTMDFGGGRVVTKDYELATLTQCGTIRFTCGLDIQPEEYSLPDYMCGAKFENLIITDAKATVLEEMDDDVVYSGGVEINRTQYNTKVPVGEWDILNSNPETIARFNTIIYTPSCVDYDYDTAGQDVYSFGFDAEPAK